MNFQTSIERKNDLWLQMKVFVRDDDNTISSMHWSQQ